MVFKIIQTKKRNQNQLKRIVLKRPIAIISRTVKVNVVKIFFKFIYAVEYILTNV